MIPCGQDVPVRTPFEVKRVNVLVLIFGQLRLLLWNGYGDGICAVAPKITLWSIESEESTWLDVGLVSEERLKRGRQTWWYQIS